MRFQHYHVYQAVIICMISVILYLSLGQIQGLQEKFCKAEQDYFGAPGTAWDFSLKIENLRSNKTTDNIN
jgi:hypothetical protein